MKHLAAYLLIRLGGNDHPSASDIKEVLGSVGVEADDDRLASLLSELDGKDINELIAEGKSKLATPIGGNSAIEQASVEADRAKEEMDHDCDEKEGGCCDDCGDDDLGLDLFE